MRALIVAVLLMASNAAVVSAQAVLPPFDTTRFYSEADFAAAIRPYTAAVARNANDAQAHHWLGIAYLHIAKLHRIGLVSFGQDAVGRAISSLERAMQLRPQLATLMPLIDAYMMADDIEKWRAAMDRSLTLAPPLPLK